MGSQMQAATQCYSPDHVLPLTLHNLTVIRYKNTCRVSCTQVLPATT